MQIKATDGSLHLVAACLILRLYGMLPKKALTHADALLDKAMLTLIMHLMHDSACNYMHKAAHNIKRLGDLHTCPLTLDDVKTALALSLMHAPPWMTADMMYLVSEFLAARFMKHLLSKYIGE